MANSLMLHHQAAKVVMLVITELAALYARFALLEHGAHLELTLAQTVQLGQRHLLLERHQPLHVCHAMLALTLWQEQHNVHYAQQVRQILTLVLQLPAAVCNALLAVIQLRQVPLSAHFVHLEHFRQQ